MSCLLIGDNGSGLSLLEKYEYMSCFILSPMDDHRLAFVILASLKIRTLSCLLIVKIAFNT